MIQAYDPTKKSPPPPKRPLTLAFTNGHTTVDITVVDPFTGTPERDIGRIDERGITLYHGAKAALEEVNIDTSGVEWAKDGAIKFNRDNR